MIGYSICEARVSGISSTAHTLTDTLQCPCTTCWILPVRWCKQVMLQCLRKQQNGTPSLPSGPSPVPFAGCRQLVYQSCLVCCASHTHSHLLEPRGSVSAETVLPRYQVTVSFTSPCRQWQTQHCRRQPWISEKGTKEHLSWMHLKGLVPLNSTSCRSICLQ